MATRVTTNPARRIEYALAGAAVAALILATTPAGAATILASPLALNGTETYAVKIFVKGNTVGNNTGLDALALNGVIAAAPESFRLTIAPTVFGFDLVLNVDIAPTILTAARIGAPATLQGHDLAPLYLAAQKPAWRTEFFYEHPTITSTNRIPASEALVRKDWKYFFWPNFNTEQLFGLDSDPMEENDRAADPAEATRLAEMRARFTELKAAAW